MRRSMSVFATTLLAGGALSDAMGLTTAVIAAIIAAVIAAVIASVIAAVIASEKRAEEGAAFLMAFHAT